MKRFLLPALFLAFGLIAHAQSATDPTLLTPAWLRLGALSASAEASMFRQTAQLAAAAGDTTTAQQYFYLAGLYEGRAQAFSELADRLDAGLVVVTAPTAVRATPTVNPQYLAR